MFSIKNSRKYLFIKEYITNIKQYDGLNYINLLTLENNTQYIYNFVYLERLDNNFMIGVVAKPH
ncbi:MAG: hypothetical protein P9M11_02685 [Candidatus Tenebribacter burtonii]|jgi:hypothetical protein|nr:hypothetical protein [Candidatus Tenebribacter burtonii]